MTMNEMRFMKQITKAIKRLRPLGSYNYILHWFFIAYLQYFKFIKVPSSNQKPLKNRFFKSVFLWLIQYTTERSWA